MTDAFPRHLPEAEPDSVPLYLIGVDGGGTGTRVSIAHANAFDTSNTPDIELSRAVAGPSGLGLGVPQAWQAIQHAVETAFREAALALDWSRCVMGCGLAGANHAPWREAFLNTAPPLLGLVLAGDATTTVLGAHGGRPGVAVALGTGSIGIRLDKDGALQTVGGFGFPSGDEASGAWLGLRVIPHLQKALDGRGPMDRLAHALLDAIGLAQIEGAPNQLQGAVLHWLVNANQTAYATLAPVVAAYADHPLASALLDRAAADVAVMIDTLDPQAALPLALTGSVAPILTARLPSQIQSRIVPAGGDATRGALLLAKRIFKRLYP